MAAFLVAASAQSGRTSLSPGGEAVCSSSYITGSVSRSKTTSSRPRARWAKSNSLSTDSAATH
eukprot:2361008-Lingulodinium_polyedra.AAC.1